MQTLRSLGHVLLISLVLTASLRADGPAMVDFSRDVQPILKAHCVRCHDAGKQRSGYRLDVRSRAFKGGESGKVAIIPGNSAKSDLLRRVLLPGGEEAMPPGKERLSEKQIATLRAWIDSGARWPDALAGEATDAGHWAFRAPERPPLPAVKQTAWIRNEIDRFILARLEKEGLRPSPEAERVTLARRLSLDLVGLPPAVEAVDAFVADGAYERLVGNLLTSPHYGERWGRLWLDAARYADSDGFEKDKARQVWLYRDWVVSALNRDLPYDRFIIDQIAGDLLPNATQDQRVATGYLRNSMINEEGGVDPEQFRMEAMYDRMDAIGKGILGLTIQCGQCHTHKYDPLTQKEYYRLFAFLNNCDEASIVGYTPDEQQKRAELLRQVKEIEDDLRHRHPDWRAAMHAWERQVRGDQPAWTVVRPALDASGGQKHFLLEDGSILAGGYAPTKHTTDFTVDVDSPRITAVRLELLNDPNLPLHGPGRSIKGLFGLTEFKVVATPRDDPKGRKEIRILRATADVNPPIRDLESIFDDRSKKRRVTGPIEYAIDGRDETAWGIDAGPGRRNVPRKAVFVFEEPIAFPKGGSLTFRLTQNHGGWNSDDNQNNNLGRFRFSVTGANDPVADPLPTQVRQLVERGREGRTPGEEAAVFASWRSTFPGWRSANERIETLWRQHPEGAPQLVLEDRGMPRATHVLKRGDFLKPGESVTPDAPAFLHPLAPEAPRDRLTLARWLVDRRSPTTARVLVNRIWQAYFGTGLVSTPEDFGTQGDAPSHPALLDWLAVEFMERGWSVKALHQLIVSSATYRQSSRVTPELLARDPYNRLLARAPRYRADAEVVRDMALTASGLLHRQVGGPSVYPPLPAFLMLPPVSYGPKVWQETTGPERYRRALYTFRYRSVPYPALQNFDAPNGDFACVKRTRSNTPLQALTGLNETLFLECAQALGMKTLAEGGKTDAERVTYAFRRCVARTPTAAEQAELLTLLARQKDRFARPNARPWDLAAADPTKPPALPHGATASEAAAWTAVARVLLNLDETITRE